MMENTEIVIDSAPVTAENKEANKTSIVVELEDTGKSQSTIPVDESIIETGHSDMSIASAALAFITTPTREWSSDHISAVTEENLDPNHASLNIEAHVLSQTITEPITVTSNIDAATSKDQLIEKSDEQTPGFCYEWVKKPILLCSATEEYIPTPKCENFTKGCQWSPDGTCLLVPSEDFRIRVYELPRELYAGNISGEMNLPSLKSALSVKEGGIVYDSCWFPMMSSWDPSTCCFATTSKESPVHLWDAFTGELRATYRAYNQVDEVEAAISVQFVNSGAEVWCGFKGALRTFDTGRPGRQVSTIYLKKDIPNVTGIISSIRENPVMPGLVAFGTYSKSIGLYKDGPLCAFKTGSGVTQIEFSPCGMKLYSAVRRNNEMLCWDLRNPGTVLYSIQGRQADTNQRIQFSISSDGKDLVSGATDGTVAVWHLLQTVEHGDDLHSKYRIKLSNDCINGVSLHRSLPIMATSSGQRICTEEDHCRDNSVRFWWCGPKSQ
ncbi:telomerase Cajal body protein 1 isoform X1 [Athalia rosae]|uniref:telomerase Cajal body protein 1 isoform X1 n=1 Tax=Athalia rosae TaxID=37344 RepID=UPI002033ACFC|nr:telomerase Cajal body protein 1 isoform X1 [Athalia rosae]XP_048504900.1 telomerase Cajal body protein 1 isoform X1 [Athalia rosae]XP_048504901.1 telomerase Cajal body protein 1 isoform X1 [Athalia rosae]XP_048504902.1 telomerase Cajal body protein 1 isoform X1 [Athalia rosae]XP_048504903.1 telomerase Cajal body protein 1 isoform X1 [Athalia rosae]